MRILGLETEYGLIGRTRPLGSAEPWGRLASDEAATALFIPLASRYGSTNVFLPNGGRLYLDVGNHPEYATPECTSVADLLVAEQAGDELMVDLAEQASRREAADGRETTFELYKNNVDSFGSTYGSHENLSVSRSVDPDALAAWLVPFLVARQALAGAGRWHRGTFTLSQRCDALGDVVSHHTTRARPLINTRDEPHADPEWLRRLHVISGDSNCDQASAWLRHGTTELVVRLAEAGGAPPVVLSDPVTSLRQFGRDEDAARRVLARYAERADAVADGLSEVVTAWRADAIVPEWRHKRGLIEAYARRHGLAADDSRLDALDLRWHLLGPGPDGRPAGLAERLRERGTLRRLTDPDAVASAHLVAPSATRARLRGRLVDAARRHGRDASVDWARFAVHDVPASSGVSTELRLDDPFTDAAPGAEVLISAMSELPRVPKLGAFRPPS